MRLCGEVAERSKAAVLKTVEAQASQGSNPCLSAIFSVTYVFFPATLTGFSFQKRNRSYLLRGTLHACDWL